MSPAVRVSPVAALLLAACGDEAPAPPAAPQPAAQTLASAALLAELGLPAPDENGVVTITWDDLMPEGEWERLDALHEETPELLQLNHFGEEQAPQIGTFNVVEPLLGHRVRMPGYILPLDIQAGGAVDEFLLVPYYGACVHEPPPPPNQIVHVVADQPMQVDEPWTAVWVTGRLTSDRNHNDLGDAAYTIRMESSTPYRW
jgi:hypothetical protein